MYLNQHWTLNKLDDFDFYLIFNQIVFYETGEILRTN